MDYNHHDSELIDKIREMIKLLNIQIRHFPRHEKYALSQEIRQAAYGVYLGVIESSKRYHKKTALTNTDIAHEQLRMLVHLAFDLGYYEYKDGKRDHSQKEALRRYTAASLRVNEVGKMLGGWIRSQLATNGVGA